MQASAVLLYQGLVFTQPLDALCCPKYGQPPRMGVCPRGGANYTLHALQASQKKV